MLPLSKQGVKCLATRKLGSSPAVPEGNEFTFYVPDPSPTTAGATPAAGTSTKLPPAKPIPTLTVPAGGGAGVSSNPRDFIKSNFVPTSNANFGTKSTLGGTHRVIRRVDVVRAALEGGYGRRSNWSSALVLNKAEARDLARHLAQRLQMVAACIETDAHKATQLRSFYKRIEASEKTALSFILGGIGAYLAAQQWLTAGGDCIRSFLHVGIFTKGIANTSASVAFSTTARKIPDYLVEGDSGDWHVFESKGGHANGRWARICQGLAQLAHVPQIGWAGKPTKSAVTCVCVHTSVDPSKTLRVTAVDPPPGDVEAEGQRPLVLVEGVCRLVQMLEALEQYRALADGAPDEAFVFHEYSLQLARSSLFGQLLVGVPDRYLQREDEVRLRLAVFFSICEVLDEWDGRGGAARDFVEQVKTRMLEAAASSELPVKDWTFQLREVLDKIASQVGDEDFLYHCSQALQLEALAAELMPASSQDSARLILALWQSTEYAVTSGGLFLREGTEASPNREG